MKVFVFGVAVALVTSLVSAGKQCSPTKSCNLSNACCSAAGICGRGPEFCGAGCQGGACLPTPMPSVMPTSASTTTTPSVTPTPAPGNATAVAAGSYHTCALLSGGSVRCWGGNYHGQLGDGTTTTSLSPVSVVSLGGAAIAVAAGGAHTCALLSGGSVRCWGYNYDGQLGDGTTTHRLLPVSVVSLGGAATAVVAGGDHTCALLSDGSVRCWGYNYNGQLGDGTIYTTRLSPVSVISLGGAAAAVAAGSHHTCALLSGGSVRCWGYDFYGQLGDDTITNATAITVGSDHTCALLSDSSVKCWGGNGGGELGDGTTTSRPSPVSVISLGGAATAIAAGGGYNGHTCALLSGGSVRCWGYNIYGQLGDGTTTERLTPVSVISLCGAATAIAAGGGYIYHTCALLSGGSVRCWGYNEYGQLGDRSTKDRHTPVSVKGL